MTAKPAPSNETAISGQRSLLGGLRFKATGIAILLGTLPVLAVGTAAYQIVKSETGEQVEELQQSLAIDLRSKVNVFMRDRYGDIQTMANLDIFTDPKLRDIATVADKEAALERLLVAYPVYNSIGLFDRDGEVIAQTAGKYLGNHNDRLYVQEALAKDGPVLSQPLISTSSGIFSIYAAAPIKDKVSGETIGYIRSRVPVSIFEEFTSNLGASENSDYFLINRDGNVFFGPEGEYLVQTNSRGAEAGSEATSEFTARAAQEFFPELQQLQASTQAGSILGTSPADGESQLISYVPPQALAGLPELGWSVALATDTDIAFAAQQQLLRTLVGGTALAAVVVALVAVILADRATRPILSATETVTQLGQGQLAARVEVRGEDEVAQLGANINQMAARIQTLVTEIESSNAAEIQQQNELLQADVGHILDVVSAVEEGDLTIKAEVSDRATGLVSDTLNRLIEELGRVLAEFAEAAQQVSYRANQQKKLTGTVTENALQQAQAVARVLELNEQVERAAGNSEAQVRQTSASLQDLEVTVNDGQGAIAALNEGITVLEQGSNRIVQQMKALGEFVGLTDRFVHDQSQIASLTQVLAMNASLVAARASEQRDPDQFIVVAREFESIASQVGELARQTNDGLVNLEQQSAQIHNAVATIDASVQGLGELVREFTGGVEQSSRVFGNVRTVTQAALQTGEAVAQANQDITRATQATTSVVGDIANRADKTVQLAQNTQAQSEQMDNLSVQLRDRIEFFRLPVDALPATLPAEDLVAEAEMAIDVPAQEVDRATTDTATDAEFALS